PRGNWPFLPMEFRRSWQIPEDFPAVLWSRRIAGVSVASTAAQLRAHEGAQLALPLRRGLWRGTRLGDCQVRLTIAGSAHNMPTFGPITSVTPSRSFLRV